MTVRGSTSTSGNTLVLAEDPAGFGILELDVQGQEEAQLNGAAGVAYKSSILTPAVKLLPIFGHNTIESAAVSITADAAKPATPVVADCTLFDPNTSFDFIWQRDQKLFESQAFNQTFGSRLGEFCDPDTLPDDGSAFVLGSSRLGGPRAVEQYHELESYDFRRIAFGFEKEDINTGVKLHSFTVKFTSEGGNGSTENLL